MSKESKEIVFHEGLLESTIQGMLKSVSVIMYYYEQSKENEREVLGFGYNISTTMILTFCIELLLKYKIQQEGKTIASTHSLRKLFYTLDEKAQTEIKNNFEEIKSGLDLPFLEGWDEAESVILLASDAFVEWRYLASNALKGNMLIAHLPLVIVAQSIYETTPMVKSYTWEEVTELRASILGESTDK